jgi:DNA-binding beta-propeller fold protein YncE
MRNRMTRRELMIIGVFLIAFSLALPADGGGKERDGSGEKERYAAYAWPAPPDQPRIRLRAIFTGRVDVEATSRLSRILIGASPQSAYDRLKKPFGVKFDGKGRLLVTDTALGAVFRFDRAGRRMDVFGSQGSSQLVTPLGLAVARDGTVYVADAGRRQIVAYEESGTPKRTYGQAGELSNPTGVAVSPDQTRLFVADSREHRIAVFDIVDGTLLQTFGRKGRGEGELFFPTSVIFSREGELCVVDQMNARIVVYTEAGEFVDSFGEEGTSFGRFVRPKDIAIDEAGLIYVTDAAFGNVQIFANDLRLLTFVGSNGAGPGQFHLAAGIATRGDDFAVVDQMNGRVQLFRFIAPRVHQ